MKWKLFDLIFAHVSPSHRRLSVVPVAETLVETPPGLEGLPGPDPETRSYADDHGHQIFDHEHGEVRGHGGEVVDRAGDGEALAGVHVPGALPLLPEGLLVEITGDHDGGRNRVEDAEHPDPNHQLLQLLRFGAVMFHDGADPEKRHEASQQEGSTDEQVDEQRR